MINGRKDNEDKKVINLSDIVKVEFRSSENGNDSGWKDSINKTGSVSATKTAADVCAPYYMGKFIESGKQDITNPSANEGAVKRFRNGQLVIERNGVFYSPDGKRL